MVSVCEDVVTVNQGLTLVFSLLLCVFGEMGVDRVFFFVLPSLTAASCPGSGSVLKVEFGLGERGDPTLGLFVGEILWADGQMFWFRHTEQRGLTGRQTCCPNPTSSQLISLHSSLQHMVRATSQCDFNHILINYPVKIILIKKYFYI